MYMDKSHYNFVYPSQDDCFKPLQDIYFSSISENRALSLLAVLNPLFAGSELLKERVKTI